MWRQRDSNSKHLLAKEICYQLHYYPQVKQLVFTDLLLIVNGFCLISKLNYLIFTDLIVFSKIMFSPTTIISINKGYRMRDSNPQEYNTNSLEDYYASNYVLIL